MSLGQGRNGLMTCPGNRVCIWLLHHTCRLRKFNGRVIKVNSTMLLRGTSTKVLMLPQKLAAEVLRPPPRVEWYLPRLATAWTPTAGAADLIWHKTQKSSLLLSGSGKGEQVAHRHSTWVKRSHACSAFFTVFLIFHPIQQQQQLDKVSSRTW